MFFPKPIQNLINSLAKLPGIGPKTAERLAFSMLKQNDKELADFSQAIKDLKANIKYCHICFNIDETDPCFVCQNEKRDKSTICIVENPLDLIALEKAESYSGYYHVLHGILSPIDGIGPNDIKIEELIQRIKENRPKEIILALNPSLEGEATCSFIKKQISNIDENIMISKIARGLPTGSNIEYADNQTLQNALQCRQSM